MDWNWPALPFHVPTVHTLAFGPFELFPIATDKLLSPTVNSAAALAIAICRQKKENLDSLPRTRPDTFDTDMAPPFQRCLQPRTAPQSSMRSTLSDWHQIMHLIFPRKPGFGATLLPQGTATTTHPPGTFARGPQPLGAANRLRERARPPASSASGGQSGAEVAHPRLGDPPEPLEVHPGRFGRSGDGVLEQDRPRPPPPAASPVRRSRTRASAIRQSRSRSTRVGSGAPATASSSSVRSRSRSSTRPATAAG